VEQRVKVMDTLDKKMQTILEREDLWADERLKLYDQSLNRYLNGTVQGSNVVDLRSNRG
jgi:queuine/archaeosine tRNA-ribosyltransferase